MAMRSWEEAVEVCRSARQMHQVWTVLGKEAELEAIGCLQSAGFGVREIARMTGVPKSTVARLLKNLDAARRELVIDRSAMDQAALEAARGQIQPGK